MPAVFGNGDIAQEVLDDELRAAVGIRRRAHR
jgi:hypothetical protein